MKRVHALLAPVYYFIVVVGIAGVLNVFFSQVINHLLPSSSTLLIIPASNAVGAFLGALCCFTSLAFPFRRHASSTSKSGPPYALALWGPLLIGLVYICQALVQIVLILEMSAIIPQNWSNIVNLCMYPLLLCLLVLLPTRPTAKGTMVHVVLDSVIILLALSILIWYILLGPLLLQAQATLLVKLLGTLYPLCDLLLLCCFLLLSPRFNRRAMRTSRWLVLVGLALLVLGDGMNAFATLSNTSPLFVAAISSSVSFLLLILSTFFMRFYRGSLPALEVNMSTDPPAGEAESELSPFWISLLPYALIPPLALLLLAAWSSGRSSIVEQGAYAGITLVVGLILLRQILTLRQSRHYALLVQRTNARLAALATTDLLTELPNSRALATMLTREFARAQRYRHPCSLLFLDLDHFKALNDGYGHAAGDSALHAFARLVQATIRASDCAGRWGGEEFVVLLPETEMHGALAIAERIRTAVSMHPFELGGGGLHLTCSIGVASYPKHAQLQEDVLRAADQAMYGAKRLGRNQVRTIDDPAVVALAASGTGGREEITLLGTVKALALLVERRDESRAHYAQQVGEVMLRLAVALHLPASETHMLQLAGQLHDIGKIAVPDALLCKAGPLTNEERKQLESHAEVGGEVVSQIPSLRSLAPLIRGHHESWDGQGYPDQLAGPRIPLGARLLAVADAYSALIGGRTSQPACSPIEAVQALQRRAGTQFDPLVIEALVRLVQEQHGRVPTSVG